ncbi:hypothetical protein MKQ70_02715 [Chitinophaga sedimenti]|uniref:hypothetical protein n=1 Tax=Chitinophaga sedimenti TaxID=2033606 RepID=UPI00200356EF|nr:hypothetical protein [Chitinophaga sedimenti]MCK7553976.1 hypothetical protein [Chitinophaga sedimenti]
MVAVRTAEIDGFEYKATQAAMVMPPFYERHGGANICFQRVRLRDNKALGDSMLLKDNKIYVDKRDKSVYFVFQHPDGKEQVIKFKSNRLYSYYQLLPGCQECSPNFLCTGFLYDRFSLEKRKIISDNWYEFAGENLEAPFPCGEASVKSMALRLDGVGCVYPAKVNNNNLQSLFLDDRVSRKNVRARTFYSLMRNHNGALDFRNDSSFYSDLKGNIEPYARRPLRSSDTFC